MMASHHICASLLPSPTFTHRGSQTAPLRCARVAVKAQKDDERSVDWDTAWRNYSRGEERPGPDQSASASSSSSSSGGERSNVRTKPPR